MTVWRALRLLGIGRAQVEVVPVDDQGAMRADALRLDGPAIVCAQAGNVNSGAFDPLVELVAAAREHGAWVHVDGAFGLWAAASPALAHLTAGAADADSWATDGHKWLNVPYDCGVVAVRDREAHAAAMGMSAAYLIRDASARSNSDWVPEASRRGRGFAVYAALRSLGRSGIAELVERNCALARRLAERVAAGERRGAQRRRAQPGAARRRGRRHRPRAGRRRAVGRRHRVARPPGDARLGLELVDDRGGRRPQRGRDPQRSASARLIAATTASGSSVSSRQVKRRIV